MKALKALSVIALAATSAFASAAPKGKVFVNAYYKSNYAVVSVSTEENPISGMEVTDESGSMVYVTKRVVPVKAAQYLLNIAALRDGVYNVNFTLRNGGEVSKTFVVANNEVVR